MKITALILILFVMGCSSFGKKNKEFSGLINAKQEQLEVTRYQYESTDKFFNEDGIWRERTENTDFVVLTRFLEYAAEKDQWQTIVMTSFKDGPVNLHDLGFPEKNERIDYIWDSRGRILKAGKQDPQSLFFIPGFPYPQQAKKIGESWTYDHDWITKKGLAMKLKVNATLKDHGSCFDSKQSCWIVDLKGEVVPPTELTPKNFKSQFAGRVWLNDITGIVTQSWTASLESMQDGKDRLEVRSCLSSQSQEGGFPPCPSDTPK